MKRVLVVWACVCAWAAWAENYVVTVEEGAEDVTWSDVTDAGPAALLAGDVKDRTLVKEGKGRLIIACDLKGAGYAGQICVSNGYLRLYHDGACGTEAGGVVVANGATLEGDSSYVGSGGLQYKNEALTFEGFGVDGKCGAVHMLKNSNTWLFFLSGTKTMTGDSLWVGDARLDVRAGTFDMGGHTLYVSNSVAFVQATVKNPGRIEAIGGTSSTSIESSMDFAGDASNVFLLNGASGINLVYVPTEPKWTLAVSNSAALFPRVDATSARTNLATAVNYNRWGGPIYIGAGQTLTVKGNWGSDYYLVNLNGKISGPGALKVGSYYGYLRLKNLENDFMGGVTVDKGCILEAAGVGSLGTGPLSITGTGRLAFLYGDMGVTDSSEDECARILAFRRMRATGQAFSWTDPYVSFRAVPDFTYTPALADGLRIWHEETNTLTLAGTITANPEIDNAAGILILAGAGDNQLGEIFVRDGTLVFAQNTRHFLGTHVWKAMGCYPALSRVIVDTNALVACSDDASVMLPRNYVGGGLDTTAFRRGVLEIRKGAVVTNQLTVGGGQTYETSKANDMGAVYLNGTLVNAGSNARDNLAVGMGGNGYFEIGPEGYLDASKKSEWILVGSSKNSVKGQGVMQVNGGRLVHLSCGFGVNDGGGDGHLRVSGCGIVSNDTLIVGKALWSRRDGKGGEGVVTVADGVVNINGSVQMGGISNSTSIVNLNGGFLRAWSLYALTNLTQMSGSDKTQICDFNNANNPTYLNFNGGEYRVFNAYEQWLGWGLTRCTIYAGGAVIDVGDKYRTLRTPLQAPSGNGVVAVAFACDEPWRYLGAPYVKIVDPTGTGFGASAIAEYDSVQGTVTGVTVTSPGCDYGEGTYAEIGYGGWTNMVRAAVTLAANDCSGGFTKKGSGTLSIQSTNTWRGVTHVQEGLMAIRSDDAIPYTSGVAIDAGATFWTDGHAFITSGTLAGAGTFNGDYTVSGTFTIAAADVIAGRGLTVQGKLTILPGTRLVVTEADTLPKKLRHVSILSATGGITGALTLDPDTFAEGKYDLIATAKDIRFGSARGLVVSFR